MKRWKQIISVILALALVLTACFQYGIGAKAADAGTPIKSDVSAIWSGQNGQMITFQLASSDWDSHGAQNVVPGSTYNTYNFYNNVQIYYNDGTGEKKVSLGNAHFDQIYFSMWGNANALSIQINPAYYPYATKIVIPAGTVFPAFAYTGGTPLGGAAIAGTSNSMDGYVINEDIVFEGTANATSQTYWTRKEATAVETVMLDLPSSTVRRLVFNIAGDEDNDALANWCYITSSKHDEYNTKDYVEIYLNGESTPKTLRNYYKTTDGNMYWNLYEAGSITFPLLDNFPKATEVEKIVIKKGCEFPSVAYTGANDPVGGGVFSATTNSKASYVVQEDVTFVISEGATDTNAKFTFVDTSATRETAVTGIKTGHNSNVATFSLSTADYADCSTSRPSEKFEDYNFMDMIQIVSGDTVQTLKDVYLAGDQIYYNMWDMQDSITIALGSAYDTVTKIVIPAGTVFPSATYTGYGAWDATSIPDNMARNKGGFETTADITYEKPSGSGELIWTVAENEPQPVEVDTTIQTLDIKDNRFVFNISGDTDNDALTEWTYIFQVQHDAYNFKDNIEIYISGESAPKTLRDIFNTSDGNLYWNLYEAGSMSIPLISGSYDCTKIEKIVIKEGCQFPSVAFTGGNSLTGGSGTTATTDVFTTYVIREEVTFVPRIGATQLTAAFEIPDTSATIETKVTGINSGHNNKNITFTLSVTDYSGCSTNRPSEKFRDYNFMDMIQIHSGDTVQSLKDVYPAGEEIYYNLWDRANTLTIALGTAFDTVTKIVIPAGTVFPSAVYTGYGAWNDVNIPDNMVTIKGGFKTTEDITYEKPSGSGELIWTVEGDEPQVVEVDTTVETLDIKDNRFVFNISGDADNDALTEWTYIFQVQHDAYNFKDNIEIYILGESAPKTLRDIFNTSDGNLYWNLYEAGSMSIPLISGSYDCTKIEKIVIKEGCQFPSVAFTGGNSLTGGSGTTATTDVFTTYVIREEVTLVPNRSATSLTASFVTPDAFATTETKVTGIKTGHSNKNVTFTLSETDYAGCETNRPSEKFKDYNFMDMIQIHSGDTVQSLKDVYPAGEEIYYNLWGMENTLTVALGTAYDTVTKIVIPAGTVFPAAVYTGYGAWNDVNIPDNMVLIKGGFETTTDITYVKPEGTGELIWFKEGSQPVKEDTSVTNIHVRTGEGSGTRLLLFLSVNDYGTQGANIPVSITANQYNLFERIFLYTTEGEKFALSEVYDNEAMYNLWGEFGSFSVKLKDGLNPIHKVEIEAGCEFSSRTFTDGTSETRLTYVAKESVVFMANSEPQDNVMTVHWTRTEVVPTINEDVEVIKVHLIGREGNVRLVLFLDQHDYEGIGESIAVTNKYLQYNSLENIVLCKGNTGVPLSEIVTDEIYYNLWGNQGSVSYGLKPEYSANSFDNIIVKKGCEFPSYEYTSDENAEYKVAYTTTEEKTMSISELKYKIIYVGENQEVLYQDEVVCGSEFTLRSVPEKEGYTGSWDGLRYDVMPAQNITYRLLYESNSNEEIQQEQDVVDSSDEKKESPSTGDAMNVHTTVIILLLSMMAILTICFAKKWTDKDGGKNGR